MFEVLCKVKCGCLVVNLLSHQFFCLVSNVFSTALHTKLSLFHPLIFKVSHYICNQPLDLMGIHLFCYTHGGERTTSHDVVWNVFVANAKMRDFTSHKSKPMSFAPSHVTFMPSNWHHAINQWCLYIGKHSDIVFTNLTRVDLVLWIVISHGVVMTIATQAKEKIYHNQFLMDMFILLIIEVFKCLHQQANEFFHHVPIWHGEWSTLKAFLFQFCMHFINRGCH
jgi:hypothetical protein